MCCVQYVFRSGLVLALLVVVIVFNANAVRDISHFILRVALEMFSFAILFVVV